MASTATEAKSLKKGDFMLSKWEEDIEGKGTEAQKDGCYASELVNGEPSMSKDVTAEDLRPLNSPQANTALKPRGVKAHWITEDFRMRSVTLAASALEVLLDKTDEVVHEDADTVVTFLRNILQSFGVEAFSLTANGPTVMTKSDVC
ncbi:hypothetical protein EMCRGX_G002500 [Ephydatia muelleri]